MIGYTAQYKYKWKIQWLQYQGLHPTIAELLLLGIGKVNQFL